MACLFLDVSGLNESHQHACLCVPRQLEVLAKRESSNLTTALRVTSENFLTSAVEVLAEETRFLEDTKGHFWKTTAYFLYSRQVRASRGP